MASKVEKVKTKIMKEHEVFYDSLQALDVSSLKKDILRYTKYLQEVLQSLSSNKEVKEAEAAVAAAKQPFVDKIKNSQAKIKQLKGFVDESICVDDLELQMIKHAMEAEEQKIKMDASAGVKDAKSYLDDIKGPFTDSKSALELKISYINILISEKEGFEPGFRDEE